MLVNGWWWLTMVNDGECFHDECHGFTMETWHFPPIHWLIYGNSRRYLPYIRPIFQGYGSGDIPPISMAGNMVQYLHFRILEFPLTICFFFKQSWNMQFAACRTILRWPLAAGAKKRIEPWDIPQSMSTFRMKHRERLLSEAWKKCPVRFGFKSSWYCIKVLTKDMECIWKNDHSLSNPHLIWL